MEYNRIGCTKTHTDFEIAKVLVIYYQQYMEEFHKYPEVVPNVDPKDWLKILETVEE